MSAAEWLPTVATAFVGTAGIAATLWATARSHRHAERLARLSTVNDARQRRLEFYADVISSGRLLQRSSVVWTKEQNHNTAHEFDEALQRFSLLSAQSRLLDPEDIYVVLLAFEQAYREHRENTAPQLSNDPRFRLSGLLAAIKQHALTDQRPDRES